MVKKRYVQFSEDLLARIASGEWQVGEALPPEMELTESSGFSRSTVRLALTRLEKLGMVSRKRKRGTILIASAPNRFLERQIGSAESFDEFARSTRLNILEFRHTSGESLSKLHSINHKLSDNWFEYTGYRTWLKENTPISWTCFSFDGLYEGAKGLIEKDGAKGKPSFRVIEDAYRLKVTEIDQSIRAIAIPPDIAKILHVPAGSPGLEVKRLMCCEDGKAIIHAHLIHRAEAVEIKTKLNMGAII